MPYLAGLQIIPLHDLILWVQNAGIPLDPV